MKEFACAEVVPGCDARIRGEDEQEVMSGVAAHARDAHGMTEVPPEVAERVQAGIRDVPA